MTWLLVVLTIGVTPNVQTQGGLTESQCFAALDLLNGIDNVGVECIADDGKSVGPGE
jgi:hypothetical protein